MSVYSTGVDAYRDTTKWLAAFVPIVSLGTAILVAGPRLVRTIETAPSVGAWLEDYWLTLVCGIALFCAMGAILATGAKVLSIEPTDIADLVTGKDGAKAIEGAIGSGVVLPEFFDKDEFDAAMAKYQVAAAEGKLAKDDPSLVRLKAAIEALREWSIFSRIQGAFKRFQITFIVSAVIIVCAVVLAPAQLGSSAAIDKPTQVDVEVNGSGAQELKARTGCSDPAASTFYATGGTWDHPKLTADGPGCRFASVWYPDPGDIELLAAATSPN